MKRSIVNAKLDIIFKKLFADKKNEKILHAFISDMLDMPYDDIKHIEITDPEMAPDTMDEKFSRLDISLNANGTLVNYGTHMLARRTMTQAEANDHDKRYKRHKCGAGIPA